MNTETEISQPIDEARAGRAISTRRVEFSIEEVALLLSAASFCPLSTAPDAPAANQLVAQLWRELCLVDRALATEAFAAIRNADAHPQTIIEFAHMLTQQKDRTP